MSDELLREATRNHAEAIAAKDAEIERLQSKCDRLCARGIEDMKDEIERLREALERIAKRDPLESIAAKIALAALEADADRQTAESGQEET